MQCSDLAAQVALDPSINEMKVLYDFVQEVAGNLGIHQVEHGFRQIKNVLEAGRALPNTALESIQLARAASKEQLSLTGFASLAQGQALLQLAQEKAEERKGQMQRLSELEALDKTVSSLRKKLSEDESPFHVFYVSGTLQELKSGLQSCAKILAEVKEGDRQRELAARPTGALFEILTFTCQTHFEAELKDWVDQAMETLKVKSCLPKLLEFLLLTLRDVVKDWKGQPAADNCIKLLGFYDDLAQLIVMSEEVAKGSAEAGRACAALSNLKRDAHDLSKCFPGGKLLSVLDGALFEVQQVWERFYQNTLKEALRDAASALKDNITAPDADSFTRLTDEQSLACVRKRSEAEWVATGLTDPKRAAECKRAASVLKSVINVIQAKCQEKPDMPTCVCEMWHLLVGLGRVPEDTKVNVEISLESVPLRQHVEDLRPVLFGGADITLEIAVSFFDAWLYILESVGFACVKSQINSLCTVDLILL